MQAAPLGFFLFLVALAAGGILATVALDWEGEVSPGFLVLNGIFLLAFAAAGIWLRVTLPAQRLVPYEIPADLLQPEVIGWVLFAIATAIQLLSLRLEWSGVARTAGTAAAALGLGALAVSAAAYRPPAVPLALMLATFATGAVALGTVWSGMMLGHWYLVTPRLATRPLLALNAVLAATLVIQAALLGFATVIAPIAGDMTWLLPLLWLRGLVGIAFPLGLCWMIWRTARTRSMMSATGLLYIALGCVLAGEIIAKALLFALQWPM